MEQLVIPSELQGIIKAVIEFYEDAVNVIEPSIVFAELKKNLINWVTDTNVKIEEQEVKKTGLTSQQRAAYNAIINFIEGDEQYFRLNGYAGTGKSFLMVKIIQWLKEKELKYAVVAPTNKAAKNLRQMGHAQGVSIQASTVARLLKLQPVINMNTGKQEFENTDSELNLNDYDVIILDEYSMLNKDNFKDLQQEIYGSDTQIIFVGDNAQLPPVSEKEPIVARHRDIKESANLTEVVRYEGEIGKVAATIRSDPRWNRQTYPFQTAEDQTVIKLEPNQWLTKAIEHFQAEEWLVDPDFVRIIAWRNKTVDRYNQAVRKALYGSDVAQLVVGDRLIAKKPVFRSLPGGKRNEKAIIFNNSEECKVIETPNLEFNQQYQWDFFEVNVRTDEGTTIQLRILTTESEEKRQKELKRLAKRAKEDVHYSEKKKRWAMFFELDGLFDNMAYAYALTCHKAQGSSIDNVFLAVSDMHHCPDKQKMLYTGLTRAKKCCYVA
ncbi:MAG TPA: hypothetical protein DCF68_15775 [Cyanothece sp. UBA12306]|nr:hypothetical protein [Cyanothece sp. UBA12306]